MFRDKYVAIFVIAVVCFVVLVILFQPRSSEDVGPGQLIEQTVTCYDAADEKTFQASGEVTFDMVARTVTVGYETRETVYNLRDGDYCDIE